MTISERTTAIIVGALFLIAMVTSLVGAGLIEAALTGPDYLADMATNEGSLTAGVVLELINGICVVGIAFMMFPILRRLNEGLALGYAAFRLIEAVIIIAAVISPLALVALGQEFAAAGPAEAASFQAVAGSLVAIRSHLAGQLLGIFFSLAALIFYALVYQSALVPRFLSVWGLIAAFLILVWNGLELLGFSISAGIVFGLPIILNEIVLGIWLIAKGFNAAALEPEAARPAIKTA